MGSSRSARRGIAAGVLIVVVLAVALALAQEPPSPPVPDAPPTGGPSPATTSAPTPPPSSPGSPATPGPSTPAGSPDTPPRISAGQLRDAVLGGAIDEQLVFVDGVIRVTPVRCQSPAQGSVGCVDLEIPGLGLPVWAGAVSIPWRGDPPPGAWIVTVARSRGLVYLGSLLPDPAVPDALDGLTRRLFAGELAVPPRSLSEVDGFLVVDPSHICYRPAVTATPCPVPPPFLAADEPSAEGVLRSSRGGEVDLELPVIDVDPATVVTAGRFLVMLPATCDATDPVGTCDAQPRWRVVARFDPARSVRVLVP